ncbi:gluconate 5-dehydrogenase [Microbotryum lychnidis-dioicae p1A1 Lamole]|uniref:Gluconate 5-dehydrogenase n=2 Tax=Microbotryum TaxID=34416 RepID=U5H2P9_USTV1|nr:gluconate 5-dehydrogenase [Microbotryum lychnidis-dioicae p1A1 Lamole]SGZ23937.1 BQ5605_C023g09666 [Microbotryum silenes-dioicae]|eukprot:KDE08152.1 gluconate 5-dehydrogenase [Microbotryum lychnidis-dioicae p1A1 Lamole]
MSSAPSFSVKGKVVLVTGGAKGIGKMITTGYVAAGAKVYISSRDKKSCDAVAQELTKLGPGSAHSIPADLASYEGVEALVAELSKREKHLNVLVNNAGNNWGAPLEEYPDAAWDRVLGLNLKRVFTLTQKCVPLLLASLPKDAPEEGPWNDPARIINIGSVDGIRVPSLETYAYSSSKAALHQLSRVFAAQLGRRGVTSNTIACGPFESKMMAATLEAGRDLIVAGVPLGRIGAPQDVSGTCIFLSSPAGAWVNGATIALDGGALVGGKL